MKSPLLRRGRIGFSGFRGVERGDGLICGVDHHNEQLFDPLPAHFGQRLRPAFRTLLNAAGAIRTDLDADQLLRAGAGLGGSERRVEALADGLRRGSR